MAQEIEATEESLEAIRRRLRGPRGGAGPVSANIEAGRTMLQRIAGVDPDVSQAGVPSHDLRAGLSRADTKEEQELHLTKMLGEGGWSIDTYGRYMATPAGAEKLGIEHDGRPIRIDEPAITKYDISDLFGDVLPIAGPVVAAALAPKTGGLSLVGLSALSGMAGKGVQEGYEHLAGENIQSLEDVLTDVGMEGVYAGAGEGPMMLARGIGRYAMKPQARRMTEAGEQIMRESAEIGATPKATQITRSPLIGRAQGMMDRIFGDPLEARNAAAINTEMHRLQNSVYPNTIPADQVGKNVKADIGEARKAVGTWADGVTTQIDQMTGGVPVIGTNRLKTAAQELLDSLPKHKKTGKPIFTSPETERYLTNIIEGLDDYIPVNEQFRVIDQLWKAVDDDTILPGIASNDAKTLWLAARESFGDISTALPASQRKKIRGAIGSFRRSYDKRINQFADSLINRITKDERFANSVDPEVVVEAIFTPGKYTGLKKVIQQLSPESYAQVRRVAMRNILQGPKGGFRTRSELGRWDIFHGDNLLKTLDGYGKPALNAMFGKKKTQELYRLGRVTKLVQSRPEFMSGSMVAATLALKPLQNLGKLVRLNILSRMMDTEWGLKYLTDGIEAPRTRKGVDALARLFTQAGILSEDHTRELEAYQPVQRAPKTQGAPGPGL
jgi:hypothetical protein